MQKSRRVIYASSIAVITFIVWAGFFSIDQTTRVTGSVISGSHSQNVQTTDGGVIEQLLVKEGAKVEKGQLLAVIDKTRFEAAYNESATKTAALKAQLSRLKSEVLGVPLVFTTELKDYPDFVNSQKLLYEKRQTAIRQELSSLGEALKLAKDELDMSEPLLKTGDVAKSDILRLKRQVVDIQTQISTKKNKYFQDSQTDYTKAQEDLDGVSQNLAQKKDSLDKTNIVAPMSGVVKNVKYTTIGAVLKVADELMQIVPSDDALFVEVKIKPQDIAHIKPGSKAIVKIDAYDYTIYGSLNGTLVYVSADTIDENLRQNEQPYYKAKIKVNGHNLKSKKGEEIIIGPGMTATCELITGSNTILKYLLKPIVKTISESMNER
jgi:membrane fusion protein, adhesin transport system